MRCSLTSFVCLVFLAHLALPLHAARYWDAGGDGSHWEDGANWDGNTVPSAGQDVTLSNSVSVVISNVTPHLSAFSITNATLRFTNWVARLDATTVTIEDGGVLTCEGPFKYGAAWMSNRVYVTCTDLNVEKGGKIDVNEKGYDEDEGPEPGERGNGAAYSTGAGHGGRGGSSSQPAESPVGHAYSEEYDLTNAPFMAGSGGGNYATVNHGSPGGGVIRIDAGGIVTVHGTISANSGTPDHAAGAGAGGAIYISCGTFSGTTDGLIEARGGDAYWTGSWYPGGGGAGGRIAVDYSGLGGSADVRFRTSGGKGWLTNDWDDGWYMTPGWGTVWVPDTGLLDTELKDRQFQEVRLFIGNTNHWQVNSLLVSNCTVRLANHGFRLSVDNGLRVDSGAKLGVGDPNAPTCGVAVAVSGGNLVLTNGGSLYIYSGATNTSGLAYGAALGVTNNFIIGPGSRFCPFSHGTDGSSVSCKVDNLMIAAGGVIEADGKGFQHSEGPGRAEDNTSAWPGGGGYGGKGGLGRTTTTGGDGGPTYGSTNAPLMPGSGGGDYQVGRPQNWGGYGGGLVWIVADGTVSVNGTITADGETDFEIPGSAAYRSKSYAASGGSGGAIYIDCQTLGGAKTGVLRARGGDPWTGSPGSYGGAGGGGRIAAHYSNLSAEHALRFTTARATGGWTYDTPGHRQLAHMGTLYFSDTNLLSTTLGQFHGYVLSPGLAAWQPTSLTVSNATVGFFADFKLDVGSDLLIRGSEGAIVMREGSRLTCGNDMILTNGGSLLVYSGPTNGVAGDYGALVSVTGNLAIYDGSWIYPYCDETNGGAPLFLVNMLDIVDTNAGFKADATGFDHSTGPGQGTDRASGWAGGGGYGGQGGPSQYVSGGNPYGVTNAPIMPGSGGGDYQTKQLTVGGFGGGVVRIQAESTVTVNGVISANGQQRGGYAAGGGAGGGIFVTCSSFSGGADGVLRARGGNADSHVATHGGGGGGGRIAVGIGLKDSQISDLLAGSSVDRLYGYVDHAPFLGEVSVAPGLGQYDYNPPGVTADPGTAYFVTTGFVLTVDGSPAYYDSPTPHGYGTHAGIDAGTEVTNSVTSPLSFGVGARRTPFRWVLEDSDGGPADSGTSTQAVFQFTTNLVLTWYWTNQYQLTADAIANGTVNVHEVNGWYTNGWVVTNIEAQADPGFAFLKWTGDLSPVHETDNPLTVTMNQARVIYANFSENAVLTNYWTGKGLWDSSGNWSEGSVPKPIDVAVIQSGTVIVDKAVSVWRFDVTNGAALMFTNWSASVVASNVTIYSNALVTLPDAYAETAMSNRVRFVCTNFTLTAGGSIDVDGKGFLHDNGPGDGAGNGNGDSYPGGGGHGGHGGNGGTGHNGSTGAAGGPANDLTNAPTIPGSGGDSYQMTVPANTGGNGGGVVRIDAKGLVTLDGTVSADGTDAGFAAAGGAGGAIYISCNTFVGGETGILRARGGDGYKHATADAGGGGGSGGRIAVAYDALGVPMVVHFCTSSGVDGWRPDDWDSGWEHSAEHGTLWLSDFTPIMKPIIDDQFVDVRAYTPNVRYLGASSLTVSNGSLAFLEDGFRVFVTNDLRIDNGTLRVGVLQGTTNAPWLEVGGSLTITNGAKLYVYASDTNDTGEVYGARVRVTNDVVVGPNSWIYPWSHETDGSSVLLEMDDLSVAAGGGINAIAKGFLSATGPGAGQSESSGWPGGGGYGGRGANGSGRTAAGGDAYGSANAPTMPGSGGGDYQTTKPNWMGGRGGGLVRVVASGTVTLDGTINADGEWGYYAAAGGAGGGVYLTCNAFGGTGAIEARGANASISGSSSGGAGGGGRIAVNYGSLVGSPTIECSTGIGAIGHNMPTPGDRSDAFAGTIWFPDTNLLSTTVTSLEGYLLAPGFSAWSPSSLSISNVMFGLPDAFTLNVGSDLVVGVDGVLVMGDGAEISCGGDLTVQDGGQLRVYAAPTNGVDEYGTRVRVTGLTDVGALSYLYAYCDPTNSGAPLLEVGDLTVQNDGVISADGAGFLTSDGPGEGSDAPSGWSGGAGYGGKGGDGTGVAAAGGSAYGSSNAPTRMGSGGGTYQATSGQDGGHGGGIVWIQSSGHVTINGTVTAGGEKAGYAAAGGSGGSIFITTSKSFSGNPNGRLWAKGNDGNVSGGSGGGAGGGGRIAVWYGVSDSARAKVLAGTFDEDRIERSTSLATFIGQASAARGSLRVPNNAEDGSVVFLTVNAPIGTMIILR